MPTSETVTELEGNLGASLPPDCRAWLLDPNAPCPVPSDVTIPDESPWTDEVVRLLLQSRFSSTCGERICEILPAGLLSSATTIQVTIVFSRFVLKISAAFVSTFMRPQSARRQRHCPRRIVFKVAGHTVEKGCQSFHA